MSLTTRLLAITCALSFASCAMQPETALAPPELPDRAPGLEREWSQDSQKFTFAIVGDKSVGFDRNWDVFDRAVEEINQHRPDFAIMVGDLIEGSNDVEAVQAQWTEFRRHADPIEVPFLWLPGNHDVGDLAGDAWWREHIGRTYWDFRWKDCHFLLLNTQEDPENWPILGDEQITFATESIARNADDRHTFIFMHVPLWEEPPSNDSLAAVNPWFRARVEKQTAVYEQWRQIETALGDRPATVFGGHGHTLSYEQRNGRRYIMVGATGGDTFESDLKQLGGFHHYSLVTVDGDSAHITAVEPGSAWNPSIATKEYKQAFFRLTASMRDATSEPVISDGRLRTSGSLIITNPLPDPVTISIEPVLPELGSWKASMTPDHGSITVAPGETDSITVAYDGDPDHRLPASHSEVTLTINSVEAFHQPVLFGLPYRMEDEVVISEWHIVGAYDARPFHLDRLGEGPAVAMPRVLESRGLENGWTPGAAFRNGDQVLTSRSVSADTFGVVDLNSEYGAVDRSIAYAMCAVWSPDKKTIGLLANADNMIEVYLNGSLLPGASDYDPRPWRGKTIPVTLEAGWNTVVLKIINNRGDWSYRCLLLDHSGEIRVAPHAPGE
jgi:hypothetical protein